MKRSIFIGCVAFLLFPLVASSQSNRQAPPLLLNEVYRLAGQCYFFQEYATLEQKNKWYVLALFLSRETVRSGSKAAVSPQSSCGPKPPQVRLYRVKNDTTIVFCDSVLIDSYSASIGMASAFDDSGLQKLVINQACNPLRSAQAPLLCYALSVFEITSREKFRNLLTIGNLPERWANGHPTGRPLEPVVTEDIDKTIYPELLAVDDFFEGDPAFRADDFPKITLVYAWDPKANAFKNKSEQFPGKFAAPVEIARMPDEAKLVTIIDKVMALAAVKRIEDARKFMDLNLTPERFVQWREQAPERGSSIAMERIKELLVRCIARYK